MDSLRPGRGEGYRTPYGAKNKPSADGCNTVVQEVGGWIGWYPGRGRYRAPSGTNKGPSINYLMPIGGLDSR